MGYKDNPFNSQKGMDLMKDIFNLMFISPVRKHSKIEIPILVLHSKRSTKPDKWKDILKKSDMVLDVRHIRKDAVKLGPQVTLLAIEDAIHDVFLSQHEVREKAFRKTFEWLSR